MLKKLVMSGLLGCCIASTVLAAAPTLIPAPPQLAAKSWILMDADTGKVLIEENADQQLPPASLTKMMTSYVVSGEIHKGKLKPLDKVLVSVNAWRMGGSKTFIREGTEVAVEDLLRGVIIQSGNDASVALAEHVAGSEDAFADVMNQQATLLGMTNSNFANATGWPAAGHVTTARDLSLLARALINDYPEHYQLYAEKYYEYNGIRQPNRNLLLWRDKTVDGVKTGHTEEAGYCLVSSALRNGMRLIAVVMGTTSEEARASESQKLLSYGFRYYETAKVYAANDVIQENVRVWYGRDEAVNVVVPNDVFLTIPRGSREQLAATVHVDAVIKAPLTTATELGRLKVEYEGETLLDQPLVADREIARAGFFARIWDGIKLFFLNLFS